MIIRTNRSLSELTLSFVLLVLTGGCSSPFISEESVLKVENQTSQPLILNAYDLESSHVVDPILSFTIEENQMTLIQSGEVIAVSTRAINGNYGPDKDLRFFFYIVRKDSAFYQTSVDFTHEELERRGFHIEIKERPDGTFVTPIRNE